MYQCSNETCTDKRLQFKITQLLCELKKDVDGCRTKAICSDCWERRDKALGRVKDKTLSTLGCVQAQKSAKRWK